MTLASELINFFRWVTLAGMILTCLRLHGSGISRRYPVFFAFLLFSSVRSAILLVFPTHTSTYMKLWVITQPIFWVFYILLVLELYSLILENHKGLYTLGRWAMYTASALAFLVSIVSLFAPTDAIQQKSRLMPFYLMTERGLLASLLFFLFLLLAFLSRYPLTLPRNTVVHSAIYSAFFLSSSMVFLLRSIFGLEVSDAANALLAGISAACVTAWLLLLNARGEELKVVLHASAAAGHEEFLVRQLNQINATVMRAARK